jgi:hypothetical protein
LMKWITPLLAAQSDLMTRTPFAVTKPWRNPQTYQGPMLWIFELMYCYLGRLKRSLHWFSRKKHLFPTKIVKIVIKSLTPRIDFTKLFILVEYFNCK